MRVFKEQERRSSPRVGLYDERSRLP
jgi:hypothetical protein